MCDLKDRFISICKCQVKRDGIDKVLDWLEGSDFYTAPASTRFHGNHSKGLLEHSLNVYDAIHTIAQSHPNFAYTAESLAIVSLFHDLCKVNFYVSDTRNVKDKKTGVWNKEPYYRIDDQMPLGHGEKSVIILMRHMQLNDEEIYAIRWHMGGYDSAVKGGDFGSSKAYEICPLAVMLHLADITATYFMEGKIV